MIEKIVYLVKFDLGYYVGTKGGNHTPEIWMYSNNINDALQFKKNTSAEARGEQGMLKYFVSNPPNSYIIEKFRLIQSLEKI